MMSHLYLYFNKRVNELSNFEEISIEGVNAFNRRRLEVNLQVDHIHYEGHELNANHFLFKMYVIYASVLLEEMIKRYSTVFTLEIDVDSIEEDEFNDHFYCKEIDNIKLYNSAKLTFLKDRIGNLITGCKRTQYINYCARFNQLNTLLLFYYIRNIYVHKDTEFRADLLPKDKFEYLNENLVLKFNMVNLIRPRLSHLNNYLNKLVEK